MPFSYQKEEIDRVEASLSPERLYRYMQLANGDRTDALLLHERNTRLASQFYGPLQGLEIALRNAIHRLLSARYGPDWYDRLSGLSYPLPDKLSEAKASIARKGKLVSPGRVVAELSFGFWTALLAKRYEKRLWVPHLHRAFPHAIVRDGDGWIGRRTGSKLNRSDIWDRLDRIRLLRNQIAHHEAIVMRPVAEDYQKILGTIEWICPTTAAWVGQTNEISLGTP
jgi:hypothetical protein